VGSAPLSRLRVVVLHVSTATAVCALEGSGGGSEAAAPGLGSLDVEYSHDSSSRSSPGIGPSSQTAGIAGLTADGGRNHGQVYHWPSQCMVSIVWECRPRPRVCMLLPGNKLQAHMQLAWRAPPGGGSRCCGTAQPVCRAGSAPRDATSASREAAPQERDEFARARRLCSYAVRGP
jgi:hypothetical protein